MLSMFSRLLSALSTSLSLSLLSTGPKEIVYPHGDHTDLLSEDTLSILRAER